MFLDLTKELRTKEELEEIISKKDERITGKEIVSCTFIMNYRFRKEF